MPPALRQPLDGLRFGLAGAGRVGSSLAHWAVAAGARLEAVAVHRAGAGLARALDARAVPFDRFESSGCDLLLVAVADPALDAAAAALARRPQAAVALHTAGSRGAGALAPLAAGGTAAGTLHPLKAFRRPLPDPAAARGTVFAVGGDPAAEALARRLIAAWDGVAVAVPDERRVLYHLAASLAAGGAVTLVAAGYLELARGALAEVDPADPAAAITGPVARGDAATVARQLEELAAADPELVPLAVELGRETLRRLAAAGRPGTGRGEVAAALARAAGSGVRTGTKPNE